VSGCAAELVRLKPDTTDFSGPAKPDGTDFCAN
jgi:hypothetical protein